jgi:hypothetical protein
MYGTRRHRRRLSIFLSGHSETFDRNDESRSFKMGKSMYNFGKQLKEKAKQQKQMNKAAKRILAKQQKANLKTGTPSAESDIAKQGLVEAIVKSIA